MATIRYIKIVCDVCKKEIENENNKGTLLFSYTLTDCLGNGIDAGKKLQDICEDCSKALDAAIKETMGKISK